MKLHHIFPAIVIVLIVSSFAIGANYWVVRNPSGDLTIVESEPTDPAMVVKGPFSTRSEAQVMITGRPANGNLPPAPIPGSTPGRVPGSAPASPPVAAPSPGPAASAPNR